MKRTLLFLLCALMSTQVFSETEFGARFPTLAYLERTSCHYLEGEEQNRTLNRLKFEDNMFEIDGNYYVRYHDMWLREDYKGRILVYSEPAKKDLVLYDFTLEVGDTLTTLNIDEVSMTEGDPILPGLKPVVVDYPIYINGELSSPIDTLIVTDVSMVMMCDSNQYKKWTFSNGMEYMEYIGNLGADFFPIIKNPWEPIPTCCIEGRLVCASIYDRLIYQMDDAEMQRLNAECQCSSWASKWCDTWNVLEFNGMDFEQTAQTWQYKLAYDTIIDGKEYRAVTRHWTVDEKKTKEYVAAVRFEENSKAFIYYDNAEYLLYDFNFDLIEGDTLEVFAGINNYVHFNTYKCVIKSVEHTEGGITESTYSMDIIDPFTGKVFPSPMVWKEFVGSYNGILHGDLLVPGNSNYHLLCAYKNSSIAYSTEDKVFTEYGCEYNGDNVPLPEDLFPTLWGLQRTSCSEYVDCQENETYLMQADEIKEINGKQYLKYGGVFLREEDSKVLIYSFPYEKDFVLYDWTLEVGDTLQILGVDPFSFPELEYTAVVDYVAFEEYDANGNRTIVKKPLGNKRVKDISTIRLLDGNEYKAWLFGYDWERGNYYVEGIGNASKYGGDYVDLVYPFEVPSCYFGERLVCVSRDGVLLYQIDEAEMERLGTECLCDVETSYKDQWCDTWNVFVENGSVYPPHEETYRYQLAKDIVIGEHTYTAVVSKAINDALDAPHYVAAVRFTDDRKVYIYYDNAEYLLYDFNVQEGDELEVFAGINNYTSEIKTYKCTVTGVEQYACVGCPAIITLEVHNHPDDFREFYRQTQWIEGVGDINGFLNGINHYVEMDGGGSEYLLCAYKGDELKYTGDLYEEYGCGDDAEQTPEDLFPTLWGLQRTEVELHTDGAGAPSLVSFNEYTPTLVNGKWYLYDGRNYLREENNQVLLYSPEFEIYEDVVLYDWTLEIGDTLPFTMRPFDDDKSRGAVFRVTDVSTITLLDGNEYKKWTLACGIEYIEGIGAINGEGFGNYFCIQHTAHPATYIDTRLVCASRNNKLLYQMDAAEMERLGTECLCDVETSYKSQWCNKWNVMWFDGWRFDETASTSKYRLGKDTIIGDYTYSKFTSRTSVRFTNDRKVYVYYEGFDDNDPYTPDLPTGEYLAYDFSAKVGDTLEVFSGIHSYSKYKCLVHEVQTDPETKLRTITLFQLLLEDTDGDGVEEEYGLGEMTWIEGVGSPNGFLINTPPPGGGTYALLCAYKGDELKYTGSLYDEYGCEYNANDPHFPLVDWCNQWNILAHGYQGPQDPLAAACTSIFWLSNNTVNRDGQEYIPLMCSSSRPDVESTNLIGELRFTEDKQVYFYYDNTEYLLYDFDVQVGDTLDIFGGIELYSYSFVEQKTYPHVITKIDTLDDGRLQITSDAIVIFEDGEVGTFEEKQQQIWIEGLGSINGIVHTGINPGIAGNPAIVMLCAYRDDECVYKTDSNDPYWIDYTQLGCVYNEGDFIEGAFPILSGLQRTVCNEYCGETEDDNSNNITYKQTFTSISFENNKPYILCRGYLLREESNKILLYSESLNKEIVLYDFTLEVGDSLPAYIKDFDGTMYSDDTLVVTDISSVTLLDGKEYKKWTFNNGMEYVEGFGMYGGYRNGNFVGLIQELVVPCHTGTHLVCVSRNGQLLYQMDEAEMERLGTECLCDYDRGPRKDNAKDGQIGGRPTPTQWNQLELDLREMDNGTTILRAETFSYTLENDSVVANDKIFYHLARQSTKDTATTKSVVGALHFGKDEDNRVYFLRDGIEYVLYDFTAEPGDTVEIFAGINNYPQDSTYTHVVVDKDTTEDGACRMFLEVVFPEETTTATNAEKVWLAGLGSIDGIVHNTATRTSNAHAAPARSAHSSETQTSVMLCAWREDSCLYITDHPDYNDIGCIYNQDPTSIEDTHSPSPTADYQKLLRDGQLLIIHKGKTYNVLGVQVK